MYGNVHNIFIDHVDHSDESNKHHHHGDGDDILIHYDDECNNNDETAVTIHYGFGSNHVLYGPANHTHDKPAAETDDYDDRDGDIGNDDFDTSTHPDNYVPPSTGNRPNVNIEWADNIYNVTGGFPPKHDNT